MNNIDLSGKRIFLAPLDWGLGHATRSIPIIQQLLEWKATVVLGGDGRSFQLLKQEFPNLDAIELPSYNVKYSGNAAMVAVTLLRTPQYLMSIKKEHDFLQHIIEEHHIDLVISDNRYGLFSKLVPCVFICHQIALIPPNLLEWAAIIAYRLHRVFLDRFNHIWIPDFGDENNLTGKLTLKYPLTDKMSFIGALSRFQKMDLIEVNPAFGSIDIVCVLSGPEPQRTLLETTLLKEFENLDRNILLVQGKTENFSIRKERETTLVTYLKAQELNAVLRKANAIISRSGYSTIMDLSVLGKKAILIPTPGQTEQEYLAQKLSEEGKVVAKNQNQINLKNALEDLDKIEGFNSIQENNIMKEAVWSVLKKLLSSKF